MHSNEFIYDCFHDENIVGYRIVGSESITLFQNDSKQKSKIDFERMKKAKKIELNFEQFIKSSKNTKGKMEETCECKFKLFFECYRIRI